MLLSGAGLLGLCGVGVGAAASHEGGGELARLSSQFLLFHAAAVAGIAAYAAAVPSRAVLACGVALTVGTAVFSGDIALVAFGGVHLVRGLAPLGGGLLLLGWLGLIASPWLSRPR